MRYAFELAHTFDATLHLLHVVEDPNTTPWAAEGFPLSLVEVLERFQDESRKRLLASVPAADLNRVVVFCPIAAPVPEILRYVQDENIDLIVMGTHGRGFVAHALIGSVAERVVRVRRARVRVHGHRYAVLKCQPPVPRDVVGVRVRLQDVRDLEAVLSRQGQVVLDLPLRVDDRRLAAVGDEVGRAPEILVQHLTEEHAGMIGGRVA